MGNPIYVIGHRNPDTDTIVSAIGYADLKQRSEELDTKPVRLGDLSAETAFVLDRFGVEVPELISDVYTKVSDVMNRAPQYLKASHTIREAGRVIQDKRLVPVVDDQHRLIGVLTLDDVAARYLQELDLSGGAQLKLSYDRIVRTLEAEVLTGTPEGDWQGRVSVAAMATSTIQQRLQPGDMVVVGNRKDVQELAISRGAACVIVVGNLRPDKSVIDFARSRGTLLLLTPHDSYRVTRLLNLSVAVEEVMRREAPTADPDDLASEAASLLSTTATTALPVIDSDRKLVGIVTRSDLLRFKGKQVILVDHNHRSQAVEGLEQAQILEIIDHHNLGDLHTPEPIFMKLEPVGSTSTIVAEMYRDRGITPSPQIAGILLAGIISDTLLFRSPTSTPRDETAGRWLADVASVEPQELAYAMFKANSNYDQKTPIQILESNLKIYDWNGNKVGIGQAETVDIDFFKQHKQDFLSQMQKFKREKGLNYLLFLATDILDQSSILFVPEEDEEQIVTKAFGTHPREGTAYLKGVVSRKKQVVPPLARVLEK